jgi:hypothetical protein
MTGSDKDCRCRAMGAEVVKQQGRLVNARDPLAPTSRPGLCQRCHRVLRLPEQSEARRTGAGHPRERAPRRGLQRCNSCAHRRSICSQPAADRCGIVRATRPGCRRRWIDPDARAVAKFGTPQPLGQPHPARRPRPGRAGQPSSSSISSPIPLARSARPRRTSARPRRAGSPIRANPSGPSAVRNIRSSPRRTAAASEEPPPSPAPAGMFFST